MNVLLSKDLTNILVVVVRYFGGTLLGVPGLINAYKNATLDALKNTKIVQKTVNDCYQVEFDYIQMNDVMKIIKDEEVLTISQQFDNNCVITLEVRKLQVNTVIGKFEKIEGVKINYLYTI